MQATMYMPMPKDTEENSTIIGSNSAMRLGLVIMLLGIAWWGATITADVNTIKSSLVRLNSLDAMATRMESLYLRIETLEKRGSEPMQNLQKSMDRLSSDLQLHIMNNPTK